LKRTYIFEWPAEIFARSRFHFNKDECVVIATNNVNVANRAVFEIPVKNLVAALAQKSAGCVFA